MPTGYNGSGDGDGNESGSGPWSSDDGGMGNTNGDGRKESLKVEDLFDEAGRYIIEDYDAIPAFSDFLPVSQCEH